MMDGFSVLDFEMAPDIWTGMAEGAVRLGPCMHDQSRNASLSINKALYIYSTILF